MKNKSKTITQIRKEAREKKQIEEEFRTPKQLEIIKAFTYNNNSILSIHIYDKKLGKTFAGNIGTSSWTKKEILLEDNPTSNFIKKSKKKGEIELR